MKNIWEKLFKKKEQPTDMESIIESVEKEEEKFEKTELNAAENWMKRMLSHNQILENINSLQMVQS